MSWSSQCSACSSDSSRLRPAYTPPPPPHTRRMFAPIRRTLRCESVSHYQPVPRGIDSVGQSVSQCDAAHITGHRLTRSRPSPNEMVVLSSPDEMVVLSSRDEGDYGRACITVDIKVRIIPRTAFRLSSHTASITPSEMITKHTT